MTESLAIKTEKRDVLDVSLEIMRIEAPSRACGASEAAPLVFLHEGLGSVAMWRDFPQALCAATQRPGLVYSRRGYGQSDAIADVRGSGRLQRDYMHQEAWQVLPELLRIEGIERPVLLGHSDGGTIALLHASRHECTACIVMAPHLFVEDISVEAIAQARDAYVAGPLRERLSRYHADVDSAFWQWNDVWLSSAFCSFNIEAECQDIACPVLAIQGLQDPYGTLRQIEALGGVSFTSPSQIGTQPSPNIGRTLLKLEQCGHSPHRDQAQGVIEAIRMWLQHMPAQRAQAA